MAQRVLGRGSYKAYRLAGVTKLSASGETPNLNDKVDFEQLPFLIFPPMYAFYFVHPDIVLPVPKPFQYSEDIPFPKSAKSIRIQDADGFHDVPIAEVDFPDLQAGAATSAGTSNYCVFRGIGINPLMVAKCDAHVPDFYQQLFGPASLAECQAYVKQHGGV